MRKGLKLIIYLLGIFTLLSVSLVNVNASYNAKYYTQNIPTGYYDSVNLNLTEDSFRNNLYDIISDGYVKHSYSYNNTVLADTDPDPNSNGNIICLYTGQSLSSGSWNKEHVWAKSHGFPGSSTEPYSDAHHLRPTLNAINSSRGNLDFGEVSGGKSDNYGNSWDSSHFEPRDAVKGDVARMMFYMATRYGSKTQFNLKLVNDSTTGQSDTNGKFGNLQTLLKWHYQDPVSKEEIYRNNVIYEKYQKNRNPYIDHPEYVDLAYPNSYSDNDADQTKVNNVISLINNLPSVITLNDKTAVNNAKAAYDALSTAEKALVTNYSTLTAAVNKIIELEGDTGDSGSDTPSDDVVVSNESVTVNFATAGLDNCGYTRNKLFTVDGNSYTASSLYVSGASDVRLGHNSNTGSLSDIGLSGDGEYLEPQFDLSNVRSFSLDYTGKFGTVNSWTVYFKATNSSSYIEVASGSVGSSGTITATLASAQDGRFVFVIKGTKPRLVISKFTYTVEEKQEPVIPDEVLSFTQMKTEASLAVTYDLDTKVASNVDLRFGGIISSDAYNENAKYGVIVLENTTDNQALISNADAASAQELVGQGYYLECNPVEVSEGYQFAWVIDNVEGHYDFEFIAILYMEYDDKLYLASSTTYSVNSICDYYIDLGTLSTEIVNVLTNIRNSGE